MLANWMGEIQRFLNIGQVVQVVFDLDSTLFCVSPRTEAILRDLARDLELRRLDSAATESLATLEVLPQDWGIKQVLIRSKTKSSLEFFTALRRKWSHKFFSSEYLNHDLPYNGAAEMVQHLDQLGAEIFYLTGRDQVHMKAGTLLSLAHWGFPLQSEQHLLMKPRASRHDEDFKGDILNQILKPQAKAWFFENEPVIIERVRALHPNLKIVFVDSTHSGRAPAPNDLPQLGMDYTSFKR